MWVGRGGGQEGLGGVGTGRELGLGVGEWGYERWERRAREEAEGGEMREEGEEGGGGGREGGGGGGRMVSVSVLVCARVGGEERGERGGELCGTCGCVACVWCTYCLLKSVV